MPTTTTNSISTANANSAIVVQSNIYIHYFQLINTGINRIKEMQIYKYIYKRNNTKTFLKISLSL